MVEIDLEGVVGAIAFGEVSPGIGECGICTGGGGDVVSAGSYGGAGDGGGESVWVRCGTR